MKQILIGLLVILFSISGTALAKNKKSGKGNKQKSLQTEQTENKRQVQQEQNRDRQRSRNQNQEQDRDQVREEKKQGKKSDPPKGVENAAQRGKGKKKGLFERWFGGSDSQE